MQRRILLPLLLLAVAASSACHVISLANSHRHREDFEFSRQLREGASVSVETYNGRIEVAPWDGDTVEIAGQKRAGTQEDLDSIEIRIEETSAGLEIAAIRPERRRMGWGRWGGSGASFNVRVPEGIHVATVRTSNGAVDVRGAVGDIAIRTSNGGIQLSDHSGDADLHTSNGRIEARRIRGALTAHTSNGGIQAEVAGVSADYPVELESSNGSIRLSTPEFDAGRLRAHTSNSSITLELPASVDARVEARTSNGRVESDFEVSGPDARREKNRLEGVTGEGGGLIDAKSSNGSIRLRRR